MKIMIVIFILSLLPSCELTLRKVKYDYIEVKPLWTALANVNRDTSGFTPIDKNADIILEGESVLFDNLYDMMLHNYGATFRTVAFKKIGDGKFVWIGEQEIFEG